MQRQRVDWQLPGVGEGEMGVTFNGYRAPVLPDAKNSGDQRCTVSVH